RASASSSASSTGSSAASTSGRRPSSGDRSAARRARAAGRSGRRAGELSEGLDDAPLEVHDQLLRAGQEVAALDDARGHPALHALDELAVLATDLVVELEQLPRPLVVDTGPDEVVEEALRPVRAGREHRADREVR